MQDTGWSWVLVTDGPLYQTLPKLLQLVWCRIQVGRGFSSLTARYIKNHWLLLKYVVRHSVFTWLCGRHFSKSPQFSTFDCFRNNVIIVESLSWCTEFCNRGRELGSPPLLSSTPDVGRQFLPTSQIRYIRQETKTWTKSYLQLGRSSSTFVSS